MKREYPETTPLPEPMSEGEREFNSLKLPFMDWLYIIEMNRLGQISSVYYDSFLNGILFKGGNFYSFTLKKLFNYKE